MSLERWGINANKPPLAAWRIACKPKKYGSLEIFDLATQNDALMMKKLDKFFNKHNIPWVNLVWENYYNSGAVPSMNKVGPFFVEASSEKTFPVSKTSLITGRGWPHGATMV